MTRFTTGLVTLAFLSPTFGAFAGDQPEKPKDIVTLVGELNPKFSVELSAEDLQYLADSVKDVGQLDRKEVDINSLFRAGDEDAIALARQAIAKIFIDSARDLVDMKALVYKLAALVKVPNTKQFLAELYNAYQIKFQSTYDSLITRIGQNSGEILAAAEKCKSELCVTTIASAQNELVEFGNQLNQGIYPTKLDKTTLQWTFTDPMVKATIENTMDAFLVPNRPTNLYGSIVLAALTPFVATARATTDIGKSILGFIASPTLTRLTMHANAISLNKKRENKKLAKIVGAKVLGIVNPERAQNGDRSNDPDFNTAEPHRVTVLSCQFAHQYTGVGYWGVFGIFHFYCSNTRGGDKNNYAVTLTAIGPGVGGYAQLRGQVASIVITSPTPIVPYGRWFGVSSGAAALFGPGQMGEFVGKWGSVAHFAAYMQGLGAQIGISELNIKLSN